MMVDVRPWPKAFRPPPPPEAPAEAQQADGGDAAQQAQQAQQPRCFYFMGLSKKKVGGRWLSTAAAQRLRAGRAAHGAARVPARGAPRPAGSRSSLAVCCL